MDDRVRLKLYYHGQILLQTLGIKFVCENSLDIIIPFTLFEKLKGVIYEKMDSQISRRVSCIMYRYPISVFADRDIELEDYNSDSEEEFESNYEVVNPGLDEDQVDEAIVADVADVINALANQQSFVERSFMRSLDLKAMHAPEFPQYINAKLPLMPDGEFTVGMEFSSREVVIKAMKDYTIRRGVNYRVHKSEPTAFYAKCTQYGAGCDWLIRVSKMSRKFCWEIRRYNGSHTCTRATISQDHSKLDSNTVAEAIKPLAPYLQKLIVNIDMIVTITFTPELSYYDERYSRTVREYEIGQRVTSKLVALTDRMRYLKCVSVPVVWSMQWTSVDNGVTGEFQVDRLPYRHVFACCAKPTAGLATVCT
ncbi:hypothetical protein Ahy_B08g093579 [Arachis hypogaea]|uniref:Transposase MuDR plant domain-containing protein n=1 Tax=Arachis hypogaea TaxID=3818 RepID=A0A444Y6J3_ARAHY|nr:hypothetical protein Ahy_B08g093579 [Arachis hypogaea]